MATTLQNNSSSTTLEPSHRLRLVLPMGLPPPRLLVLPTGFPLPPQPSLDTTPPAPITKRQAYTREFQLQVLTYLRTPLPNGIAPTYDQVSAHFGELSVGKIKLWKASEGRIVDETKKTMWARRSKKVKYRGIKSITRTE